jgi:hypothetical protein
VHDRAITHRDPAGTFLELGYATSRNLVPFVEEQKAGDALALIARWLIAEADRLGLDVPYPQPLCGMLLRTPAFADFADFTRRLAAQEDPEGLTVAGRGPRAALLTDAETRFVAKLRSDLAAVSAARQPSPRVVPCSTCRDALTRPEWGRGVPTLRQYHILEGSSPDGRPLSKGGRGRAT